MFDVGRVCYKICGREANKIAIVIDKVDDKYVMVDGNVKRRKCNVKHLEPTNKVLKISKGDNTITVHKAMTVAGIKVIEKKVKEKKELKETKEEKKVEKKKEAKKK